MVWNMFLAPAQCQYIQPGLTKGENVTTRVWQVGGFLTRHMCSAYVNTVNCTAF